MGLTVCPLDFLVSFYPRYLILQARKLGSVQMSNSPEVPQQVAEQDLLEQGPSQPELGDLTCP